MYLYIVSLVDEVVVILRNCVCDNWVYQFPILPQSRSSGMEIRNFICEDCGWPGPLQGEAACPEVGPKHHRNTGRYVVHPLNLRLLAYDVAREPQGPKPRKN